MVCVEEIHGGMDEETISARPKEKHDAFGKDIHREMGLCICVSFLHIGMSAFWVSINDPQRLLCIIQ